MDIKNRMIMKKEYIKPEMALEEMLLEGLLAVSAGTDVPWNPDEDGEGGDALSNNRRGNWGNLWD